MAKRFDLPPSESNWVNGAEESIMGSGYKSNLSKHMLIMLILWIPSFVTFILLSFGAPILLLMLFVFYPPTILIYWLIYFLCHVHIAPPGKKFKYFKFILTFTALWLVVGFFALVDWVFQLNSDEKYREQPEEPKPVEKKEKAKKSPGRFEMATLSYPKTYHFIVALLTTLIVIPGGYASFLFLFEDLNFITPLVCILIGLPMLIVYGIGKSSFSWIVICREVGLKSTAIGILMFIILLADSAREVDGFWAGLGIGFLAFLGIAATVAVVSGLVFSLFKSSTWQWPGDAVDNLTFAILVLAIGFTFWMWMAELSIGGMLFPILALPLGVGSGKNISDEKDDTVVVEDEYGNSVKGRKMGGKIRTGDGRVFEEKADRSGWVEI